MKRRYVIVAATGAGAGVIALFLAFLFVPRGFGPGAQDFSAQLAGEYRLNRNSTDDIFVSPEEWNSTTPIIPSKVIECAVDRHLILAKRQGLRRRNIGIPNDTREEPAPGVFDYWILDTQTPRAFGPMTLAQFNAKRREFGVPDAVALKDVYTFQPFSIWR